MKISIIVPVYNSEKYLKRLINSILLQTYENYEIIFVNDGSTDNSLCILNDVAKNNYKVKVYTKKNEGPGLARKYGFNNSTGDLLYFVDSDDWLPSNDVLERINEIFKNPNIDILMFDRDVYCNEKKIECITPFFHNYLDSGLYDIDELAKNSIRGGLGTKIFKHNLMKQEYFTNGNNFEDYYTTYMYLGKCKNFYYEKRSFYCINRDNDNNSLTKVNDINKYIQAIDKTLEVYYKLNDYNIKNYLSGTILELYMIYIYNLLKFKYSSSERKILKNKISKIKDILKSHNLEYKIKNYSLKKKVIYYLFIKRKK